MQKFETIRQPLLWFWITVVTPPTTTPTPTRRLIPKIVAYGCQTPSAQRRSDQFFQDLVEWWEGGRFFLVTEPLWAFRSQTKTWLRALEFIRLLTYNMEFNLNVCGEHTLVKEPLWAWNKDKLLDRAHKQCWQPPSEARPRLKRFKNLSFAWDWLTWTKWMD